jgi:hypothetical protein
MQIILKSRVDHARANISIYTMDLTTLNGPNRAGAIDLLKLENKGCICKPCKRGSNMQLGSKIVSVSQSPLIKRFLTFLLTQTSCVI